MAGMRQGMIGRSITTIANMITTEVETNIVTTIGTVTTTVVTIVVNIAPVNGWSVKNTILVTTAYIVMSIVSSGKARVLRVENISVTKSETHPHTTFVLNIMVTPENRMLRLAILCTKARRKTFGKCLPILLITTETMEIVTMSMRPTDQWLNLLSMTTQLSITIVSMLVMETA